MFRKVLTAAALLVTVTFLTGVSVWIFRGRILVAAVRMSAGQDMSFASWSGNPFMENTFRSLSLMSPVGQNGIKADEAIIQIDLKASISNKYLVFRCLMSNVKVVSSIDDLPGHEDVMSMPFSSGKAYDEVAFLCEAGSDFVRVSDFRAASQDIIVSGGVSFSEENQMIDIDAKISFSPLFAGTMPEELRERVLSPEKDGWFSTQITYKGNVALLKALYSMAV
ncbi:MAG: hypothetical protein PHT95_06470 [Candidatus Omnitrophica bacterium]|jgi:hypothetical protein|nr:hypothetical protein [Candidatus Omnitrophota bacterium]MDD4012652.1 hypothetical protein [Candidatus Omnitrophota bacterium]